MINFGNQNNNRIAQDLLRSTARSFYLSLTFLPRSIRWQISLAYLLARSTDTVADVLPLPVHEKLLLLDDMLLAIQHGIPCDHPFLSRDPLLAHFHQLILWLYEMDKADRDDIIQLLTSILQGQKQDIIFFSKTSQPIVCLPTMKALDTYTYWVAGCVGEFWTKLCLRHLPHYSRLSEATLYSLSIAFGKGLQLVNILRDVPQDLMNGRCYFPAEQLEQHQVDVHCLMANRDLLAPVVDYWRQKAEQYLQEGWRYMLSVNSPRMRWAVTMPLLLGFATLRALSNPVYLSTQQSIKVSRSQVRTFMLIAGLGMVSRKAFILLRFTNLSSLLAKQKDRSL